MFIYAKSEQCDLGLIYTITNTQRIRIYSGKGLVIINAWDWGGRDLNGA